jgi:ABC-type glycerol-3-phosphate transport system permease component
MGTTLTLIAAALGAWGMVHAHRKGREDLLVFYAAITAGLFTLAVLP